MKNYESAFPVQDAYSMSTDRGMTLRDYFAAKAMQAFLTRETRLNIDLLMYAGAAYDVADTMLEARESK